MKILFCGDIVGKAGRAAIAKYVPTLKKELQLDLVIANGENAAHGFGITPKIYHELINNGVDVLTLGNHYLDQPIIASYLDQKSNIVRPINTSSSLGKGYTIIKVNNLTILIINIMGQLFMKEGIESPFITIDNLLQKFKLKENVDIIIVDMHAEATSEKNALFLYLDGKVTAVFGTHTHIPTLDYRVLPKGTAVQTDVGMCGDYNGVVGMEYEGSLSRFLKSNDNKDKPKKLEPATKSVTLCANLIEINDTTGLVNKITPIVLGDTLKKHYLT